MTNEEIIEHDMELGGSLSYFQLLDLARADERAKLSKEGVSEIKAGDFVIDENYKLLQISSIEQRGNGNLRYNFTNGNFGLKDETSLGNPNNLYKKVEVSTDERAKLSKGGVRVFVSWDEEKHATTACAVPVLSIDKPKFINHGIVGNHYYYDENDELCIGLTHAIGKHLNVQKGECKAFEIRECV